MSITLQQHVRIKREVDYAPDHLELPLFLQRDSLWLDSGSDARIQMEFVVDNATLADLSNGLVPIRHEHYRAPIQRIRLGIKDIFKTVQYKASFLEPVDWRAREFNTAADHIANYILDQRMDVSRWDEDIVMRSREAICGVQIFSDGGYAARDGGVKSGAAAVVVILIPKNGGVQCAYLGGWAGWYLAEARSAFEAEVIALDKAVEMMCSLCKNT